jgi:BirA family transcriptional regulator, biotin operon repressor / biotin---[acetyl-CoA-carboxylase] ligase
MPLPADLVRAFEARGAEPPAAIEWHETIGSTNDRLKELARQGAAEWTLVLAGRQTGGRGREGRVWVSPAGGLYLSILLRPRFAQVSLLPLAAGVAVAEVAAEQGLEVALKWPNDVLVSSRGAGTSGASAEAGGRKLAGILAEAASGPAGAEWVVLGVGVNLTTSALPLDVARQAAALGEGTPGQPDAAGVTAAIVTRLRLWYDALGSAPGSVVEAWRARSLPWWGEPVAVRTAGATLRGRLLDVDEQGALLVEIAGETRRLLSGEVVRLRREG